MKKLLLLMMSVLTLSLNAQLITEYFETASAGDTLAGVVNRYEGFLPGGKTANNTGSSPIFTADAPLTYANYAGSSQGKVLQVDMNDVDWYSTSYVEDGTDTIIVDTNGGSYFAAMIINVDAASTTNKRDFFQWEGMTSSNMARGRYLVKRSGTDVLIGVEKNSSDAGIYQTVTNGVGTDILVVAEYRARAGVSSNDTVLVYVNPDPTLAIDDIAQVTPTGNTDSKTDLYNSQTNGRLRYNIVKIDATYKIGGLRFGTDWDEVLSGVVVKDVSVTPETLTLGAGGVTATAVATVTPSYAPDISVTWSSDALAVATVDPSTGVITPLTEGTANIIATTTDQGLVDTCKLTVTPVYDVTGVTLNKSTTAIATFLTDTLVETITPANASNKNVAWTSEYDTVATVDADGVVTAVGEGTTTITVTTDDQSKTATCDVTVADVEITGVTLNTSALTVVITKTFDLDATIAPADATYKTVTYSSSNDAVATVDANGLVTGVSVGSAVVTVTCNDDNTKTASCAVTVEEATVVPTIYEYFEDAVIGENLEGYNGWYLSPKPEEEGGVSPVFGAGDALKYSGYAGSAKGLVVDIDSTIGYEKSTQRISTRIAGNAKGDTLRMDNDTVGDYYAAVLFKPFAESKDSWRDFFGWEASSTSNSSRGRIFLNPIDRLHVQFGLSKNSTTILDTCTRFVNGIESTYLLVLKYTVSPGDNNDTIRLYVNPNPTIGEFNADQVKALVSSDVAEDYPVDKPIRVNFRQRGITGELGGLRIGTSWEKVLAGDPLKVSETNAAESNLSIYPNPSNGSFTVANVAGADVVIYDITGKVVDSAKGISGAQSFQGLSQGLYFVAVTTATSKEVTKVIVK